MQVWNVLHVARWEYRTQKIAKDVPSGHHHTTLSGCIFETKARIDNRKKNLLSINTSSTRPHNMANFGPLTADIGLPVCDTQLISTVSRLGSVTAATSLTRGQPTLHDVWPSPGLPGALAPWLNFARCKIHFSPSLEFSYIGSITTRHSSSRRQPNFAAWYKEWNYGTSAEGASYIRQGGHHVGHWPTF